MHFSLKVIFIGSKVASKCSDIQRWVLEHFEATCDPINTLTPVLRASTYPMSNRAHLKHNSGFELTYEIDSEKGFSLVSDVACLKRGPVEDAFFLMDSWFDTTFDWFSMLGAQFESSTQDLRVSPKGVRAKVV